MSIHRTLLAAGILAACIAPGVFADENNEKTIVTINAPIEVPGRVLNAGTYVFKVLDSQSDRFILQIFDKNEQHFVGYVMAIPDYRTKTPDKPILKFNEAASGSPEALRAFFYPGDNYGLEFVYPHHQAVAIARRTNQNVLAMRDDSGQDAAGMKTAEVTRVSPGGETLAMKASR